MSDIKKCGIITLCGRPNVGKSSLTNALVGERSPSSPQAPDHQKPHLRCSEPGRHPVHPAGYAGPAQGPLPAGGLYGEGRTGESGQCGGALLLVEPIPHVGEPEKILLQRIREEKLPCVLCINKIDTVERKDDLLAVIAAYSEVYPDFDAIIPISARTGDGLEELLAQMQRYAVEGPQLFPDGMTTDQPDQQVCAEIIREKMLLCLDKEIPHGTAVEVTRFTEREDSGIIDLDVTIYCEKASHKGIIIGKNGQMLKKISSDARKDCERFMGTKVFLQTWVRVKENWRDSDFMISNFGYHKD